MTLDDLKADLTSRLGKTVDSLCTRDGTTALAIEDLYQPSPAGFGGKLFLKDGSQFAWELWLEDGESWNFHARPWAERSSNDWLCCWFVGCFYGL